MKTESDVITDENNGVAEWKDKYGVTHATQSDASKRPTLKKVESRRELLDRLNKKSEAQGFSPYSDLSTLLRLANHQEKVIAKYAEALEKIANFGHLPECPRHVSIYECSCTDKRDSQWDIARKALADEPMEGEENGN